ncbi:hypothetical protein [Tumebacillus flagellatus]|uniref:Uncharacterized protein n=1 Tax=Tumebacillus flagellatus TaxID=1157490 RepID=A0A074LW71_9BACL|nr:hypothetical protein [Tumebacillus flagellatus]KEO84303.1 hypothetical protein EL26_05920 [Tumebacillus flagellatus]
MELQELVELLQIGKPTIRQYVELLETEGLHVPKDIGGKIIYEDVAREVCALRWLIQQGVNRSEAAKVVTGKLKSDLKMPEDVFAAFKSESKPPKSTKNTATKQKTPAKHTKSRPLDQLWDLFVEQLSDEDKLRLMKSFKMKNESQFRNQLLDFLLAETKPRQ